MKGYVTYINHPDTTFTFDLWGQIYRNYEMALFSSFDIVILCLAIEWITMVQSRIYPCPLYDLDLWPHFQKLYFHHEFESGKIVLLFDTDIPNFGIWVNHYKTTSCVHPWPMYNLRALWDLITWPTRFISPYTSKNGILFVIFSFEANLNFSRRQIRLSILGCLGDLDNASLSKWRYKKKFTWFLIISHLFIVKHRDYVLKFEYINIWYYLT